METLYVSKNDVRKGKPYNLLSNSNFVLWKASGLYEITSEKGIIKFKDTKYDTSVEVKKDSAGNVVFYIEEKENNIISKKYKTRDEIIGNLENILEVTLVSRMPFVIPLETLKKIRNQN